MQARLFAEGTVPEYCTRDWYAARERAPHLEQYGHRARLERAADFVQRVATSDVRFTIVDLGAGDGGLLRLVFDRGVENLAWGYDLQPANTKGAAERGVVVCEADVLVDDIDWGDIAIATEMLEHLVDPHAFVHRIAEHSRFLVASSPAFETIESHYAFHAWAFDRQGYAELIETAGWRVVEHDIVDQFQVVLAVR